MKKILTACIAAVVMLLLLVPNAWASGGSNDPPPYTLDVMGLTLPDGDVFEGGNHINLRYTILVDGEERQISHGIHFDAKCVAFDPMMNPECMGHPQRLAKYIGQSSIPWSIVLNAEDDICITWVQVDGYNEHYGEGGQEPLCTTPEFPEEPPVIPEPPVTPPVTPEPPVEPPTTPEPPVTPEEPTTPPTATEPPTPGTPTAYVPPYPTSPPAAGAVADDDPWYREVALMAGGGAIVLIVLAFAYVLNRRR